MPSIRFYCRGKCSAESLHEIRSFNETSVKANFAKLKCINCNHLPFIVEYPKGSRAPDRLSRRVEGILVDDEQPESIC